MWTEPCAGGEEATGAPVDLPTIHVADNSTGSPGGLDFFRVAMGDMSLQVHEPFQLNKPLKWYPEKSLAFNVNESLELGRSSE